MTNEQVAQIGDLLVRKGFADKTPEHPWNAINHEKQIGEYTLLVWGRGYGGAIFQIYVDDPYENMISIVETIDVELLSKAIEIAETFVESTSNLIKAAVA